jgi:hypothetical protein
VRRVQDGKENELPIFRVPLPLFNSDNCSARIGSPVYGCDFFFSRERPGRAVEIISLGIRAVKFSADYVWELMDPDYLVLSRSVRGQPETITFRRIDTSGDFPLLKRGFRWVNEWGYER